MKLVILGPAGSGKGTYASRLAIIYKIPNISVGDLLREEIKKETQIGLKAKSYLDKGILFPDEDTIELVRERISKEEDYILDGFPRNLTQAEALEDVDKVVHIKCSKEVILERIKGREQCKQCGRIYHLKNLPPKIKGKCDLCGGELFVRKDDIKKEAIESRFKVYEKEVKPLIDFYSKKGILKEINGERSVNEVLADIQNFLNY